MDTDLTTRLAAIKLVIFDVDGVLTDGRLYLSAQKEEYKVFHSRDGLGIKMLLNASIQVALMSGRTSPVVDYRAQELGIRHVYQGHPNKISAFETCLQVLNIEASHTAFMGDDINDLAVMKKVGLSVAPANTAPDIQTQVHLVTQQTGGMGAARELCDLILKAQHQWEKVLKLYGHE